MFKRPLQRVRTTHSLNTRMQRVAAVAWIVLAIQLQLANAQDLVLQDTTIATTSTFSAKSISAGPNIIIASTGNVLLNSETSTVLIPKFCIVKGGQLQVISGAAPVSVETKSQLLPDAFIVHQNFPNPFNPQTEINFALTRDSHVVISIYNMLGQHVASLTDSQYSSGFHSVQWDGKAGDGSDASSGIYVYKIQAGEFQQVRKMSLIR